MGLSAVAASGPIALDTSAFIYFIEEHPRHLPVLEPIFEAVDSGERTVVTSAVTLLEVLVVPMRAGDRALADRYERLLTRSRGIVLREVDRGQLRIAAKLRATTRMRTPDALQVAAALQERCPVFLTNDRRLPRIPGLDIVQLDDLT